MTQPQSDIHHVKHLHKWAKGRQILVAIPSMQVAASTSMLIELLEKVRSGTFAKTLHDERMQTSWLSLYRDPARMRDVISSTIYLEKDGTAHAGLAAFLRNRPKSAQQVNLPPLETLPEAYRLQIIEQVQMGFRCQYFEHLAELADSLSDEENESQVDFDHAMTLPEIQFFLLVMFPCILEYGETGSLRAKDKG